MKKNWSRTALSLLFNRRFNRFHCGACRVLNQVVQCWLFTDVDDSHHCGKANPEVKGGRVQTACDILLLFRRCDWHQVSSFSDTVTASRSPTLPDTCSSLIAVRAEALPAVRRVTDRSWVRWERHRTTCYTHTQADIYGWYMELIESTLYVRFDRLQIYCRLAEQVSSFHLPSLAPKTWPQSSLSAQLSGWPSFQYLQFSGSVSSFARPETSASQTLSTLQHYTNQHI